MRLLTALYPLFAPTARLLPPERAHRLGLLALDRAQRLGLVRPIAQLCGERTSCLGLTFQNRIGVAAGLDKDGRYIDCLGALGFGFVEIGTVTPRPQAGQPCPRLFRLARARALINRMGFPNDGAAAVAARLAHRKFTGVCGVNIGKNADTPAARAADDYVECFRVLAPHADYIVVNVSSPNTPGLRALQQSEPLASIVESVLAERDALASRDRHVPVLVKISPDLSVDELRTLAQLIVALDVDGVIATNTTVSRPHAVSDEHGGLSGRPLLPIALQSIERLRATLGPKIPIIGVGGVARGVDAVAMVRAGADLVQLYTALIYRGPAVVTEVRRAVASATAQPPSISGLP